MKAYTNMKITMETKDQAVKAVEIIRELASKKTSEDACIDNFIKDIKVKENMVMVDDSCSIHSGTFEDLPAEIFKALAAITEKDFSAHAWHYSCNCGHQASVDASRRKNKVKVKTIIAPNGNGWCEECGEMIVPYDEYDPKATYYCPVCGKEIDHKELFDGDIPTTVKETFVIR